MMLEVIRNGNPHHGWLRYGGVETLDSYGFSGELDFLPPEHELFFDSLGDYFELEDYLFMHAAYDPQLPMEQQPIELLRWHSLRQGVPGPHFSGKTAIVGHTANRQGEIMDVGHLLCIDTCCYGGGWLTAVELHSRTFWQASQEGELRQP
jgi:serine/threonine protein phosphatase 1